MKSGKEAILFAGLLTATLLMACLPVVGPSVDGAVPVAKSENSGGHGGGSQVEVAVNNLSFPVLWADEPLAIGERTAGVEPLGGAWVYWETIDIDGNPVVYPSDTPEDAVNPAWKMAFEQQSDGNTWTADATSWLNIQALVDEALLETPAGEDPKLVVDVIDWGDNLESQDWSTRSKIRTEVVLFKNLPAGATMNGYEMLHIEGLGVDEMHGLSVLQATDETAGTSDAERAVLLDPVAQPIVYSNHARLTIQRLNFDRLDASKAALLSWGVVNGKPCWVSVDDYGKDLGLVDVPIVNEVVYDDVAGPGGYSAEINIKGRVVYGYTWDPRTSPVPVEPGDYRLTFSLDPTSGAAFDDYTEIFETAEEEVELLAAEGEPTVGGKPDIVPALNLTYIDIRLTASGGGGR